MTARLKWGIIGTASIAVQKMLPAMVASDVVELRAIASRDGSRARDVAKKFGIAHSFESYDELLADKEVEAVYIPLPNTLHREWAMRALEAGKHVLCEKPLAMTANDISALAEAGERSGRLIQEALMIRAHPQWQVLLDMLEADEIGEIRAVHGVFDEVNMDPSSIVNNPRLGGGALYDIGIYPVTVARMILGEPSKVAAYADQASKWLVDRTTSALMVFSGGRTGLFTSSIQAGLQHSIEVLGARGTIHMTNPFNPGPEDACRILVDPGFTLARRSAREIIVPAADQYRLQVEQFTAAALGEIEPAVPIDWSRRNIAALEAIRRAADTEDWVKLST
jgi:predicted dehydrogenase